MSLQRIVFITAYVALLIATLWLLDELAQWQFTAHLRDQAAHALALAAKDETPYHWQFRDADNIVAGRVFGAGEYTFQDDALTVRSSGDAFEIGLPLSRPIDLRIFPHLQIAAKYSAPADIRLVVRESLDGPELFGIRREPTSDVGVIPFDVAGLHWTNGAQIVGPPPVAAMIRLRVQMPAGQTFQLTSAVLNRISGVKPIDLALAPHVVDPEILGGSGITVFRLPFRHETQKADIEAIATHSDPQEPPLILLPQRGRVEQQIALRNAVFAELPGAILIPESAFGESFAQARLETMHSEGRGSNEILRWIMLSVYAILLAYFRARPPRTTRLRAFVEIALALAGPLWLILGEGFDGNPDGWQKILIALSVLYAASLATPKNWQWIGSPRAWLFASVLIVFAGLFGWIAHQPTEARHAIGLGHFSRYLVWAFLQQYLICVVCMERWRVVTGNAAVAAYLGALGFAILHVPNAALMIATFIGGLYWCSLYLRERALLPLAFSHAASGLLLFALLPYDVLSSAEVSVRFFQ